MIDLDQVVAEYTLDQEVLRYKLIDNLPGVIAYISVAPVNIFDICTFPDEKHEIPNRQLEAFLKMGFPEEYCNSRVVILGKGGNEVLRITSENHRDYAGLNPDYSAKARYDGIWTTMSNVPLIGLYGDCIQLLVISKNRDLVGIIHANRVTMDQNIIEEFFSQIKDLFNPMDLYFAVPPYLHSKNFHHTHIDKLKRGQEWLKNKVLIPVQGGWNFDQKEAILNDLIKFGVDPGNILDARINTFDLAQKAYEQGQLICSFAFWKSIYGKYITIYEYKDLVEQKSPKAIRCLPYVGVMLKPIEQIKGSS